MSQEMLPEEIDDITGVVTSDQQEIEDRAQIVKVISQAEAFKGLVKTEGWKILSEFIEGQVKYMTGLLKVEKDFDKIIRIQSELMAFESLPLIIEKSFLDYEEAIKTIKNFIRPEIG